MDLHRPGSLIQDRCFRHEYHYYPLLGSFADLVHNPHRHRPPPSLIVPNIIIHKHAQHAMPPLLVAHTLSHNMGNPCPISP
ncbi:hypothetical protein VTJ04DRAFT_7913 [Mycothermus thermophilus]|uniref:uncharacterized protein n=1 Tax=Humicola insolens TaxID=85995 RepID=UPI003742CA00